MTPEMLTVELKQWMAGAGQWAEVYYGRRMEASCAHRHKTEELAQACGERMLRRAARRMGITIPRKPPAAPDVGELLATHKWCYVVIISDYAPGKGFLIGVAIADQPGYYPTGGGDKEPWRWDGPLEEVKRTCAEFNKERLNIGPREAARIVTSTMRGPGRRSK